MLTVIANTFNSYNKKLCYCRKTKQCPTVDKILTDMVQLYEKFNFKMPVIGKWLKITQGHQNYCYLIGPISHRISSCDTQSDRQKDNGSAYAILA